MQMLHLNQAAQAVMSRRDGIRHRLGRSCTSKSVLGELHHEYFLAPAVAYSVMETLQIVATFTFGLQSSRAAARLNDSYLKRVKALQDAVAAAQQQIETAQRNAARSPYGLNRKANLFGNAARSNLR